jgi:hypothetical protein
MFDTAYTFNLIDHKKTTSGGVQESWMYNFETSKRRYIVNIERYQWDIYAIKYYANSHSQSKNKYNLLLNDERPAPIIRTCINIMLQIFAGNPRASFGFVGSPSVNKMRNGNIVPESKDNTQRFRVYQTLMFNFFGVETFEHSQNIEHSAYLLINRQSGPIDVFRAKAEQMFRELYIELEQNEENEL